MRGRQPSGPPLSCLPAPQGPPTMRHALTAALAGLLLLSAPPAEARFGKRTQKEKAEKDDDKGERKGRRAHAATAPGAAPDTQHAEHAHDAHCGHVHYRPSAAGFLLGALLHADVHATAHGAPRAGLREEAPAGPPLHVRAGGDVAFLSGATAPDGAAGVSADLLLEGQRWGLGLQATGLGFPAEDGASVGDSIVLFRAHATYALVALPRLRLRAEGGVATAHAPDVTFVGPAIGASLEACLVGPLDLEVRASVVPFPYQAVDASAGLAVHLGALTLRGGWRGLVLNDQGWVDGVTNEDALAGPQVGVALAF